MTGQGFEFCALCDEPIANGYAVEWGRSPWGDGDGWAHAQCAGDWETSQEYTYEERGPTISERQDAARRLK